MRRQDARDVDARAFHCGSPFYCHVAIWRLPLWERIRYRIIYILMYDMCRFIVYWLSYDPYSFSCHWWFFMILPFRQSAFSFPKPLQGKNTLRDDCHAPFGSQDWGIIPFIRAYHELVCVHLLLFDLSNTHGDIAQLLEKRDLPFGTSKVYTPPPASPHIGYETILMFVCG